MPATRRDILAAAVGTLEARAVLDAMQQRRMTNRAGFISPRVSGRASPSKATAAR